MTPSFIYTFTGTKRYADFLSTVVFTYSLSFLIPHITVSATLTPVTPLRPKVACNEHVHTNSYTMSATLAPVTPLRPKDSCYVHVHTNSYTVSKTLTQVTSLRPKVSCNVHVHTNSYTMS